MIRITESNVAATAERLAAIGGRLDAALLQAVVGLTDLAQVAARDNLSGGILQARTGALRSSLAANAGPTPFGPAGVVQAHTPYAAFQEYGFKGVESVRAFLRRQSTAFGHPVRRGDVAVRAHTRRVDVPPHAFLRTALAAVAPGIHPALRQAIIEAIGS